MDCQSISIVSPRITRSKSRLLANSKRKFGDELNVNAARFNLSSIPNTLVQVTKKIKLTQDERSMEGAPVGDLFDVEVLEDVNLKSFGVNSEEELRKVFDESFVISSKPEATWADKYAFVETTRRLVLHHGDAMSSVHVDHAFEAAIEAATSLRSSEVRNGLLALQRLMMLRTDFISSEKIKRSIAVLVDRTASGPKFVCKAAGSVLINFAGTLNVTSMAASLVPLTTHKSSEATGLVFDLLYQLLQRATPVDCTQEFCVDVLRGLNIGLNAKKASTIETTRECFRLIQNLLSCDIFETFLTEACGEGKVEEVRRELNKTKSKTSAAVDLSSSQASRTAVSVKSFSSNAVPAKFTSKKPSIRELMMAQMKTNRSAPRIDEGGMEVSQTSFHGPCSKPSSTSNQSGLFEIWNDESGSTSNKTNL